MPRPGGGMLAYNGAINKANLGMIGNIAFDALRDLRFKTMIVRLDGDLAGEFATRLTIDGSRSARPSTPEVHPRPAASCRSSSTSPSSGRSAR